MRLNGKSIKLGDNINTDVIISGRYTKTLDMKEMSRHVLEDLDPTLYGRMPGKIIVAGKNFGIGSSREEAPVAIQEAGGIAVVAVSYGRIFFRNAINIGLPVLQTDTASIEEGDELELDLEAGSLLNRRTGQTLVLEPLPQIMREILESGGLVKQLRTRYGANEQMHANVTTTL